MGSSPEIDAPEQTATRPVRRVLSRAARWTARFFATALVTLLAVKWLYGTQGGVTVLDSIPDAFWDFCHEQMGARQGDGVEAAQNVDATVVALACFVLAAVAVWAFESLFRRRK